MADIHLGYRQYGSEERALDFAQAFKKAFELAEKERVDFVIISGDLFHKRSEMDPITLAQATFVLEKAKFPVIVVEGNHDSSYFKERYTWIDYLSQKGYLINLKPRFDSGTIIIDEWDGDSGAYIDLKDVRIYGMKYYGALTERVLDEYLPKIKRDGFTIFTSHFGIEGYLNIYGCINSAKLHKYRNKIDYVALGHIHKKYVEDFIFNPGSLESCDQNEFNFEKGVFIVECDEELSYSHVTDFYTPRKFLFIKYNFSSPNYNDFRNFLEKNRGEGKEVVHLKISSKLKRFQLDDEKIERIVKEVLDPLVVRIEWEFEDGIFEAKGVDLSTNIEKRVLSQILRNFEYGEIVEDVLKLRDFILKGDFDAVDNIISEIISEITKKDKEERRKEVSREEEKVVKEIEERKGLEKEKKMRGMGEEEKRWEKDEIKDEVKDIEEEWDWRRAYDQRSLLRKRKKL